MNNKLLKIVSLTLGMTTILSGCGVKKNDSLANEMKSYQSQNKSIHINIDAKVSNSDKPDITWGELDQLNSYENLREDMDDQFGVISFDKNSKNGIIFIDTQGNWAGNNTLYNAFQNKEFVTNYWNNSSVMSEIAKSAEEQFSDINNESTGIIAAVNTYWNIIPTNNDGTSGLMDNLTRAEAMSAIYRADSQVILGDKNKKFEKAVGDSEYNIYASNVVSDSFLDYKNGGLCYDTYNSPITKAEALYMIVQRYWKNEYNKVDLNSVEFADCNNAGNIASKFGIKDKYAWQAYELDYCLQTGVGCPEDLYKALIVAYNHGLISSDTNWNKPLIGGTLISYLTTAYKNIGEKTQFAVNATYGKNAGNKEEEKEPEVKTEVKHVKVAKSKDISKLDILMSKYGNEVDMSDKELSDADKNTKGWTFEPVDKWMEVAYCTWLNVRTGPSTDYDILSSVKVGTKCHVVAVCKENGWYRIISGKKIVYQCGVYFKDFDGSDSYNKQ